MAARDGGAEVAWPRTYSLLAPLAPLYGAVSRVRDALYDKGWLATHRLPAPVVSVGNLTVGGTGKSPMVAIVARRLADCGARPVVVSRGYGGMHRGTPRVVSDGRGPNANAGDVGDEPVMLARLLDGVPVVVARRRAEGGRLAIQSLGAGSLVLDDGFQHRSLARDLDLLLLDGASPFGNGRLLPAGPLREPVGAMRRAGALVITRVDRARAESIETIRRAAARFCPVAPIFHARARPVGLVDSGGSLQPVERARGARVVCFAGIARPDRFFQDVERLGARIVEAIPFADHHRFTAADLRRLADAARAGAADLLLTTEKDSARLAGMTEHSGLGRFCALRVETSIDEAEAFAAMLAQAADRTE